MSATMVCRRNDETTGSQREEACSNVRRACDRPLDRRLGFMDLAAVESLLGLNPIKNDATRQARGTLLANLMVACGAAADNWVFYSRDRSHYSADATRRYGPRSYTYFSVLAAVADLEAAGLIEHNRTQPGPTAEFRSRLRAVPRLAEQLRGLDVTALVQAPHEEIRLKSMRKELIDYNETRAIWRLRRDVRAHNEFLSNFDVALAHPDCPPTPQGWIIIKGQAINPAFRAYHRIFNSDFRHGGRWYGPWWQSVPSHYRQALTIDGAATVELDIRACHPRLLCASVGLELPFADTDFDFYSLPGEDRASVKLAVNIMLNAATPKKARQALANELRDGGDDAPSAHARILMDAVYGQWPQLAPYWSSSIGMRLQAVDANVCARVQRMLRHDGVPCLSVHDSFIVAAQNRSALTTAMEEGMAQASSLLRRRPLKNIDRNFGVITD